jgi:arginyl-tRNA synthetase
MIDKRLQEQFREAIKRCIDSGQFKLEDIPEIILEKPKREEHGDLATNIAMIIASRTGKKPLIVAEAIVSHFPKESGLLKKIDVVKPGFINMVVEPVHYLKQLEEILNAKEKFGELNIGAGKKVQIEFVSANPTGPLHIGHGRGAVYGDVLGNILKAAGFNVTKEYYVNDIGGQIRTLGRSIYLRFQELEGKKVDFPEDCYQGGYIKKIAEELRYSSRMKLNSMTEKEALEFCGDYGAEKILNEIKRDLAETGVIHDQFFHEEHLHTDAAIDRAIMELKNHGYIEEKDGAIWFTTTKLGDDKDRVLKKSNGDLTYFASDIAYHKNKFDRGYEWIIDIWGADHAGYVGRMRAAIEALGYSKDSFSPVLIQLVNLVKAGKVVSMSTRQATYETLEDVRNEVGRDVCRYFFLMRSHNAQLDFDLSLAKKETPENPVFYIQYAHARIASVFRKAVEAGIKLSFDDVDINELDLPEEAAIARILGEYPRVISECAAALEPHRLAFYLLSLAKAFQGYYSKGRGDARYRIISENEKKTLAKLYLLKNCQIVLQNALRVLGISAPEEMKREEELDV